MKKRLTVYIFILVLLIMIPATGAADEQVPLTTVVATLEAPFRQQAKPQVRISDFSAEFTQLSTVVAISRTQRGEGTVWFRFPAGTGDDMPLPYFRWDYRLPTEQEVVSDGSTLWVYQQENQQVIISDIRHIKTQYGDNPLAFFSGLGDLARDFKIDWATPRQDADGHFQLLLTPRQESRYFRKITVTVHKDAVAATRTASDAAAIAVFPLVATEVEDVQGNLTKILFENPHWNTGLDKDHFIFQVPAGVEQVDAQADLAL